MRSRRVLNGLHGMYARALYRAVGLNDADLRKPLIGIVNSWSALVPGHVHLRELAQIACEGVRQAGGTPLEINTVAACDGIAQGAGMHYILPLREIVAASIELTVQAHQLDAMVCLCSCDKIVPGMLMAAARLDIPTIFVTGGVMEPYPVNDGNWLVASDVKEAIGRFNAGEIDTEALHIIEACMCNNCGACNMMGTAVTMCVIAEALG
ncbi:MAG TPA: dihydroxy-acid dehydratase, partial [Armatimonadetes bacterium]|nr:dihydroxy-acid dehydratase [Armatimonadota bacterium]